MLMATAVQGDTLAIDGSGWMFQLLLNQRVDHGGDYDLYHKTIVREVARLRKVVPLLPPHAPSLLLLLATESLSPNQKWMSNDSNCL